MRKVGGKLGGGFQFGFLRLERGDSFETKFEKGLLCTLKQVRVGEAVAVIALDFAEPVEVELSDEALELVVPKK